MKSSWGRLKATPANGRPAFASSTLPPCKPAGEMTDCSSGIGLCSMNREEAFLLKPQQRTQLKLTGPSHRWRPN